MFTVLWMLLEVCSSWYMPLTHRVNRGHMKGQQDRSKRSKHTRFGSAHGSMKVCSFGRRAFPGSQPEIAGRLLDGMDHQVALHEKMKSFRKRPVFDGEVQVVLKRTARLPLATKNHQKWPGGIRRPPEGSESQMPLSRGRCENHR